VGRVRQRDVSGGILDILCSGVGLVCGWIFQLHPFLGPNYICAQNWVGVESRRPARRSECGVGRHLTAVSTTCRTLWIEVYDRMLIFLSSHVSLIHLF